MDLVVKRGCIKRSLFVVIKTKKEEHTTIEVQHPPPLVIVTVLCARGL